MSKVVSQIPGRLRAGQRCGPADLIIPRVCRGDRCTLFQRGVSSRSILSCGLHRVGTDSAVSHLKLGNQPLIGVRLKPWSTG